MSESTDIVTIWKKRWDIKTGKVEYEGYGANDTYPQAPDRTLPTDRGLSQGNKWPVDDTVIGYGSREEQARREKDLLAKPLAQSIQERLTNRWSVDRTASTDQITGIAYTKMRQQELTDVCGEHYLIKQFGMRTITDLSNFDDRTGLRIDNTLSSPYLRDAPDLLQNKATKPVQSTFLTLYNQKQQGNPELKLPTYERDKIFFVNSPAVKDKLDTTYGPKWTDPSPDANKTAVDVLDGNNCDIQTIAPGFCALIFNQKLQGDAKVAFVDRMLPGVGGTPSSYQAVKLAVAPSPTRPLDDAALQAPKSLANLSNIDGITKSGALKTLDGLPKDHPMKTIAGAATKMVTGLQDALARITSPDKDLLESNKLVASALTNIGQLMAVMQTYADDIPRFSRLFDALVDEVYLVLATAKPYTKDDFRDSSRAMMERRAPDLKDIKDLTNETYMLSSGMDTIATSVMAAKGLVGKETKVNLIERETQSKTRGANYFEVQYNLLGPVALQDSGPLIMGTLNPSTPTKGLENPTASEFDVNKLIDEIGTRLESLMPTGPTAEAPAVAVIDITVEKNVEEAADQEINKIVRKFKKEIQAGALQLMLCKSYQKFPSLGSGKVMAGGATVIGCGPGAAKLKDSLEQAETKGACPDGDEAQLVTHFITHEDEAERPMLERSAKNAQNLKDIMPKDLPSDENYRFAEGLPFMVVPEKMLSIQSGSGAAPLRTDVLLCGLGVEDRFSFGFQNSSCLSFPGGIRIAAGQESKGELLEKFFTLSKFAEPPATTGEKRTAITPDSIGGIAQEAASKACKQTSAHLIKGCDEENSSENGPWREKVLGQLMTAGLVWGDARPKDTRSTSEVAEKKPESPLKIARDGRGVLTGLGDATKPADIDTLLKSLLGEISKPKGAKIGGTELSGPKLLAMQLSLLKQNTGVTIERGSNRDNANLLHANVKRGWADDKGGVTEQDLEAAYLPNMLACSAVTTANLFKTPEGDKAFVDIADPLIDNGLDQVSKEGQQRLLSKRAEVAIRGAGNKPEDINKAATKIEELVEKMPYREGGANLLQSDTILDMLTGADKLAGEELNQIVASAKILIKACMKRLDLQGELNSLRAATETAKTQEKEAEKVKQDAQAIINRLDAALTKTREKVKNAVESKQTKKTRVNAEQEKARGDELESRAARSRLLAKTCADVLDGKIKEAKHAFSDEPSRPPPLAVTTIGKIPTSATDTAPRPMTKEQFETVEKESETAIKEAKELK